MTRLDENYIEWLRTNAAIQERYLPDGKVESDYDEFIMNQIKMFNAIADRLEELTQQEEHKNE